MSHLASTFSGLSAGCALKEDFHRHESWIVGFCSSGRGSNGKWCAVDWETELMAAFETVVHRDFPNPQRTGCPGHGLLRALAAGRKDDQSARALAHIRECAPCFDELKQLRATNKREDR